MASSTRATNQSGVGRLQTQIGDYINKAVNSNVSKYFALQKALSRCTTLDNHYTSGTVPAEYNSLKLPTIQRGKSAFFTSERLGEIDTRQQQALLACKKTLLEIEISSATDLAAFAQADFEQALLPLPTRTAIAAAFYNELTTEEITNATSEICRLSKIKIGDIKTKAAVQKAKMDTSDAAATATDPAFTRMQAEMKQLKRDMAAMQKEKNQPRAAAGAAKHGQQRVNTRGNADQPQEQRGRQQSSSAQQQRSSSQMARGDGDSSRAQSVKRGGDDRGCVNHNNSGGQQKRSNSQGPQKKQTKQGGKKKNN